MHQSLFNFEFIILKILKRTIGNDICNLQKLILNNKLRVNGRWGKWYFLFSKEAWILPKDYHLVEAHAAGREACEFC
jgi:hypothetical protein